MFIFTDGQSERAPDAEMGNEQMYGTEALGPATYHISTSHFTLPLASSILRIRIKPD